MDRHTYEKWLARADMPLSAAALILALVAFHQAGIRNQLALYGLLGGLVAIAAVERSVSTRRSAEQALRDAGRAAPKLERLNMASVGAMGLRSLFIGGLGAEVFLLVLPGM